MLSFCQNREEGFGPSSSLSNVPTTCFVDTIIVPLPVWLYLLIVPVLFFLTRRARPTSFPPSSHSPSSRSCLRLTVSIIYYALLAAQTLMVTLEIVRLALLKRSPDMLPFQYVAIILGALLHFHAGSRARVQGAAWMAANVFVWVGLLVVTVVKLAGLGMMMMGDRALLRNGSKYPLSDQVIDVAVMAAVYAVVAVLEVVLGMWKKGGKFQRAESAVTEDEGALETDVGMDQVGWAR